MDIEIGINKITVRNSKYFDVYKTLSCGQLFRYYPLQNGAYRVVSKDKSCIISQNENAVEIQSSDTDYFYSYFDLKFDYKAAEEYLYRFDELKNPIETGRGIRILKQDFFETLISFIISANNNIPRIKGIIERLCEKHGKKADGYNDFITAEDFIKIERDEFKAAGAGFRADYLYALAKTAAQDKSFLNGFKNLSESETKQRLLKIKGVGEKEVAPNLQSFLRNFYSRNTAA